MLRYSLRQLVYFLAVAENGTVAGAARKLNVSQPSISTAIMKLESQLQVQLFLRHRAQGVSLTPQGQSLIGEARSLLSHAEEFQRQADTGKDAALSGTLHLGCFVTLAAIYLPALISGFQSQYPHARVILHEGTQNALFEGLRSGQLEQALLYDITLPDDLVSTPLAAFQPYVLLPANHHLARHDKVALSALVDEDMVLLDVMPSREYFTGLLMSHGITPKISFASPSLELVRGMVARGAGFSLLVTRPAGDLSYDGRELATRPIVEPCAPGHVALARMEGLRPTRLMRIFEKFALDYFAKTSLDRDK